MKVSDIMKSLLQIECDNIEIHPTICNLNNVIHTMQILNELIYEYEDSIDMSPMEWADIIEDISRGMNPTIDKFVEWCHDGFYE